MPILLKRADPRGQERARKLGRASSRGPEAPIVVYNDPARCTYRTRLSLTGIATLVDKRAPAPSHRLFQQICQQSGHLEYDPITAQLALGSSPIQHYVYAFEQTVPAHTYAFVGSVSVEFNPEEKRTVLFLMIAEELNRMHGDGAPRWFTHNLLEPLNIAGKMSWEKLKESFGTINEEYIAKRTSMLRLGREWAKVENEIIVIVKREEIAAKARNRKSPPDSAKPINYRAIQVSDRPDAVHNGRPWSLSAPSVAIWHPVFARFMREISERAPVDSDELKNAFNFVTAALILYPNKSERIEGLSPYMQPLIHSDVLSCRQVRLDTSTIMPDGLIYASCIPNLAVKLITEVKNEVGEGGCDPTVQAECCYVSLHASNKYRLLRQMSCCPTFLIGILGPYLQVSGAVFADGFVSQRLTEYIYLGPTAAISGSPLDTAVLKVAHLFRVLKGCLADLDVHYTGLRLARPERAAAQSTPPVIISPHFDSFQFEGQTVLLQYKEHMVRRAERAIFRAIAQRGTEEDEVIVKFTYIYGKRGHQLLAAKGLAPQLWFCEQVPDVGGLWVVVMDYVEEREQEGGPLYVGRLTEAVEELHSEGLVFGDLREPNVIDTDKGLMLIDFDWCGQEGEARYPPTINTSDINWAKGVGAGNPIQKEHDLHMLRSLCSQ
ncbi:predicted protein [Postia placenta Mad-698-R]|uniref:Protein kinase domain-containing protein n=1 Tax=Postia placenta MAD-698-R-SB12 TaxID=670580 RepID=A0A1X6MLA2_9APHY|nr:hypothetical protein POSPLADRAFT_1158283 [Postia placenta MAD-698-R-SB12]EED84629.1 predicted protein [Postia placenta Mad-698-R]OSX57049.1 hypothetical protein POSPLADRAFT_1158283 [Postia placenta MAD-698-R-SB12]